MCTYLEMSCQGRMVRAAQLDRIVFQHQAIDALSST